MKPKNSTTTPKKRKNKNQLANLHSNLSPKYIGFTPPKDLMKTRRLRIRLNNSAIGMEKTRIQQLEKNEPECIQTASPSSQSPVPPPLHKSFVSPIDKLLLKNGSTSITPIRDRESISNNTGNLQSATYLIGDHVDVESLIPINKIEDSREIVKNRSSDNRDNINTLLDASLVALNEINIDIKYGADISTSNGDDNAISQHRSSQEEGSEFGIELQDVGEVETSVHNDNDTIKTNNDNAKSPSAVSLDSAKGSSVTNESTWLSYAVGDLYWGQIFSYCYWPCVVCPDPDERIVITEENGRSGEPQVLVHVRFFADNGRRNWVKSENLMSYYGLPSYQEHVNDVRNKYGAKSSKYKLLVPKSAKKAVWYEAINEANMLVDLPNSDRLEKFFTIYEQTRTLQQRERKSSQTMYLPLEITSDFGSTCESWDTLSVKQSEKLLQSKQKRERSSSPFSPAYSPIKLANVKRRKMRLEHIENEHIVSSFVDDNETYTRNQKIQELLNVETQNSKEFKRFYSIMKEFVMGSNNNEQLEHSLVRAVHNIWELRDISQLQVERRLLREYDEHEHQLGSSLIGIGRSDGAMKRLSNRLRTIMVRRQSLPTPIAPPPKITVTSQAPIIETEKPKKAHTRPIEQVIEDIFRLDRKYLFKGLGREPICKYCYQSGDTLQQCAMGCHCWLHPACVKQQQQNLSTNKKESKRGRKTTHVEKVTTNLMHCVEQVPDPKVSAPGVDINCAECARGEEPSCRVCHKTDIDGQELITCNMQNCYSRFHPGCCRYWPQAKITKSHHRIESFRCPSHVCQTCVSDDPKSKFQHLSNAKLTKCVQCPASYHTDSTCIPAGSQIINAAHIICPRHISGSKMDATVNVSWCFICVGNGQLVCCETCPTAVHAQCLNIPIAAHEGYICEECESGRMPLYGEMVWAKFNSFRWWPAIIIPPPEVPQNLLRKAHNVHDFVVRFFGTHDHGWISRRRVYVYLEGDTSEPPRTKSSMDLNYIRGVKEAKSIYELVKTFKQAHRLKNEDKEKLHPQPYVRIKTNRAVPPVKLHIDLDKVNICDCRLDDDNPCGAETGCLNRVLYHECHPKLCPAGERCQNQMFESRISPRLEVVYMRERGFGLVCRESIAAGSFIIEYVGEIINHEEFQHRLAQKSNDRDENYYFFTVEKDHIIDAGPRGNLSRFMNHSCEPNCETQKWLVNGLNRVGLFSLKDIPENTELTFNYNWDELLGKQKKSCYCGAAKCAGEIGGKYRESKEDVKSLLKGKGTHKKTTKPLKRLQKPQWKIIPQQTAKSSKIGTLSKKKLHSTAELDKIANSKNEH